VDSVSRTPLGKFAPTQRTISDSDLPQAWPMQREEQLSSCTCDYADPQHRPFAVSKFKYRSAEALRARGLVPRSPNPVGRDDRTAGALTFGGSTALVIRSRGAAKHERSSSQVEERPAKSQDRSGGGDDDEEGGDNEGGNDEGDDDEGDSSLVLAYRPRR
jgi:hypothetical protein